MEILGRHLVPAAPSRLWAALSEPSVIDRCLPQGIRVLWPADRAGETGPRIDGFGARAAVTVAALERDARMSFLLAPAGIDAGEDLEEDRDEDGSRGEGEGGPDWTGRFDVTLDEDGAFTRVAWRWLGTKPGAIGPDAEALTGAVDLFLQRIGQHAAVPVTVAADGLSGVAIAVAGAVPASRDAPLGRLTASMRAWPREVAIGGGLFAVVLLIVIGIL